MSQLIDPIVWICLALFVVTLLLEVPIPFSMLISSAVYILYKGDSFVMFASQLSVSFANFTMLAVPAFLFVGLFMNDTGLSDGFFDFVDKWIGHLKGGMAHANVVASMIFAGMSGSALADAGGIGAIEVKTMRTAGYDEGFSVAVSAASSTLGPIIPPSINFIMWSFLSGASTLGMFLAGIIPGILSGIMQMVWIVISIRYLGVKAPFRAKTSWSERIKITVKSLPILGGPAILVGGIMTGVFTPTECGVVAAVYCLIVSICTGHFSFKILRKSLRGTLSSAAMVLALCGTGLVFNWMITVSGLLGVVSNALLNIGNVYIILLLLNLLILFLGCFLGSAQILVLLAPLLISIAEGCGLDLIHMGVMAVFSCTVSLMTPPVAPSLFVTAKASGASFNKSLKYGCQFLIPLVITLLIISYVPAVTLWLPNVLGALK